MKKLLILASLGALTLTSAAAHAEHNWRKRKFIQQQDRVIYLYDEEDDGFVSYDDDDDVIYLNRRERRMRAVEEEVDAELWWLEEKARKKLEQRSKTKKPIIKKADSKSMIKKSPAKPKTVATVKTKKQPDENLQTASLSKPATIAKPKPVVAVTKSNPAASKTIGCTAGAAVVTGYGFAAVKPKACTGATYAYTAARAGKNYEIRLTAASGEIVDVKKLN